MTMYRLLTSFRLKIMIQLVFYFISCIQMGRKTWFISRRCMNSAYFCEQWDDSGTAGMNEEGRPCRFSAALFGKEVGWIVVWRIMKIRVQGGLYEICAGHIGTGASSYASPSGDSCQPPFQPRAILTRGVRNSRKATTLPDPRSCRLV
jgi:hypothetical protein